MLTQMLQDLDLAEEIFRFHGDLANFAQFQEISHGFAIAPVPAKHEPIEAAEKRREEEIALAPERRSFRVKLEGFGVPPLNECHVRRKENEIARGLLLAHPLRDQGIRAGVERL